MGQKTTSAFCKNCEAQVMAVGKTPNHILHLILSIITGGLWLIIWVILIISSMGGYRCTRCGLKV